MKYFRLFIKSNLYKDEIITVPQNIDWDKLDPLQI